MEKFSYKKLINTNGYNEVYNSSNDIKLLEPYNIGNNFIKNRFCFFNKNDESLVDEFGLPTKKMLQFYDKIIKSDVGMVSFGGINIENFNIKSSKLKKTDINWLNNQIICEIINKSHSVGTKILLKIKSGLGRGNKNKFLKKFKYSVSFLKDYEKSKFFTFRLSDKKCNKMIINFKKIASVAFKNDFDGVLIDASSYNILGEFSSSVFNHRIFGYYSDIIEFLSKSIKNIRTIDNNKLIFVKLTYLTFLDYFYKNNKIYIKSIKSLKISDLKKEFLNLILRLNNVGVDGFIFEFGTFETEFLTNYNQFEDELIFLDYIKDLKDYLFEHKIKNRFNQEINIILEDNFNNINSMNYVIENKISNFIDITKNLYCDLNFINNIKNNIDSIKCLKCSKCDYLAKNNLIGCTINPSLVYYDFKIIKNKKNIAIVGGGLSGVISALILIDRGYYVDIFEKNNGLNLNNKKFEVFGFDKLLKEYNNKLDSQIEKYIFEKKLKIFLNKKFYTKPENVSKYDSVVVATGNNECEFNVSGTILKNSFSIYDFLDNIENVNLNNQFILYAKSELSLKLALYLITLNKLVKIIISDIDFLLKMPNDRFLYYLNIFMLNKIDIFIYAKIKEIHDDFIEIFENNLNKKIDYLTMLLNIKSGKKYKFEPKAKSLDMDIFIYEPDLKPNNKVYCELVKNKYKGELFLVGDALNICDMYDCIKSAYFVAKNL